MLLQDPLWAFACPAVWLVDESGGRVVRPGAVGAVGMKRVSSDASLGGPRPELCSEGEVGDAGQGRRAGIAGSC